MATTLGLKDYRVNKMRSKMEKFWESVAWAMISFIIGIIDLIDVTFGEFKDERVKIPVDNRRREILESIKQANKGNE
jgi:hypothetical protein